MDAGELLQARHPAEPQHRPFSSSERQVRVLDPVVGPAADLLLVAVAELGHGCLVGAQPVGGDRGSRPLAAEIKIQQDLIHWCDHLVIVTPNWWESAPALLKGYIDRVFLPEFAVRYHSRYPYKEALLRGHSARVIYTGSAPWAVCRLFRTDMFWRWIGGCVLRYCGFSPARRLALYRASESSEVRRAGFLAEVADLGRRAH